MRVTTQERSLGPQGLSPSRTDHSCVPSHVPSGARAAEERRDKKALQQWKASKAQLLAAVEGQARKHARLNVDVDTLMADLEERTAQLAALQAEHDRARRASHLQEKRLRADLRQLEQRLRDETHVKQGALTRLGETAQRPASAASSGAAVGASARPSRPGTAPSSMARRRSSRGGDSPAAAAAAAARDDGSPRRPSGPRPATAGSGLAREKIARGSVSGAGSPRRSTGEVLETGVSPFPSPRGRWTLSMVARRDAAASQSG